MEKATKSEKRKSIFNEFAKSWWEDGCHITFGPLHWCSCPGCGHNFGNDDDATRCPICGMVRSPKKEEKI